MPAATTRPARVRINVNDAWCEALFASPLQPSDSPTAGMAAEAATPEPPPGGSAPRDTPAHRRPATGPDLHAGKGSAQ